jgi:hypothetical protein
VGVCKKHHMQPFRLVKLRTVVSHMLPGIAEQLRLSDLPGKLFILTSLGSWLRLHTNTRGLLLLT